ncbi:MAG: hypothetical protein DRP60_17045 [Spirochaetes bacterium]|nr:MAG: hypothetical protein DRP60_17045 [Spirochaetota bacterium]
MEDPTEYFDKLVSALEIKAESLERTAIHSLRNHLQEFESSVSTIYSFLIEKGMIQKDPYRNDKSITELKIPSSEMLPEINSQQELSLRFSHYTSQWEFLVKIFHVSLSNLSLKKVQKMMELLTYIRWTDLSTTSSYQITRAIAGILARISQMNDPMAGKIITNSASNLGKITNNIKAELKTITLFLRERYKAEVRGKITSRMNLNVEQYRRKPVSIVDNVKFEFSHNMKEAGWYKELINELLEEDLGTAAEKLRAGVLETLQINKPVDKRKSKSGINDKKNLFQVLDTLARTGEPIRSALLRMNENSRILLERKKSFPERLSDLFSQWFSKSDSRVLYEIITKDPGTGSIRKETLNFTDFSSLTIRKARLIQELQNAESLPRKKAAAADTEKLIEFINTNLNELKIIHRRISGLDTYFQSDEIPSEIKGAMKSSSLSLKSLKNAISDTIKKFNKFKIKREEAAQLKKLGITD